MRRDWRVKLEKIGSTVVSPEKIECEFGSIESDESVKKKKRLHENVM